MSSDALRYLQYTPLLVIPVSSTSPLLILCGVGNVWSGVGQSVHDDTGHFVKRSVFFCTLVLL